jgi:hypothetical protein
MAKANEAACEHVTDFAELSLDALGIVVGGLTLGGVSVGRGHAITNGGANHNVAGSSLGFAGQD